VGEEVTVEEVPLRRLLSPGFSFDADDADDDGAASTVEAEEDIAFALLEDSSSFLDEFDLAGADPTYK
jgi:hypothetical protein